MLEEKRFCSNSETQVRWWQQTIEATWREVMQSACRVDIQNLESHIWSWTIACRSEVNTNCNFCYWGVCFNVWKVQNMYYMKLRQCIFVPNGNLNIFPSNFCLNCICVLKSILMVIVWNFEVLFCNFQLFDVPVNTFYMKNNLCYIIII